MPVVSAVLPQGGDVKRLEFDNGAVLDVACVNFAVGDHISIEHLANYAAIPPAAAYVARGTVYSLTADTMYLSCGGLLGRLPAPSGVALHEVVRVALVRLG